MVVIRSSGVKSPAAPAYSPLTPLATRKEADNNNYSPIPPMSPSTLELFETLSYDLSPVALEYTDSKIRQSNGGSYSDLKEDGDFDADTDSDYVPDSGAETDASHSSVKQNRRKNVVISESDSLENETITEGLIKIVMLLQCKIIKLELVKPYQCHKVKARPLLKMLFVPTKRLMK